MDHSKSAGFPLQKKPRRRPSMLGLAALGTAVRIRGIEVVQCVQDLQNSVPMVANKPTVVRIYLDPTSFAKAGTITGEIAWSKGGGETYLPAVNSLRINPASAETLNDQRFDIDRSLNFRLPAQAVTGGGLDLRLSRILMPGGADLPIGTPGVQHVNFTAVPPLRIRVIGLRYRTAAGMVVPAAVHFAYLKSYLGRAYPVPAIEWSHIVVDADFQAPFNANTVDLANAQIAALRSREVSGGVDPRTHYYGLVDDDSMRNFMRGKAFAIPDSPQPDVVASGPAGVPRGFAGDKDASYADWYGAHELGHTFGRSHPGFPPGQQDASDPTFPYPNGFISTPDQRFVGLDAGDPELGLSMQALSGRVYHDVMTYADDQWLSAYTYEAILARLVGEDSLGPQS